MPASARLTARNAALDRYDLAVIGAGAAGLSVTAAAAQLGLGVVLIERDRMGGDCLNTGCVPSKALLAAAGAASAARQAGRLGVVLPEPRVDWAAVRAHVRGAIAAIAPADSAERFRGLGAEVIHGHARFTGRDSLAVELPDGAVRRITARRVVVAAGSSAAVPDIPGLDRVPFLTNATLFDLAEQPEHLLILGGGPVGLEMAQAHARLGCRVTLVEAGRIAGREDAALAAGLREALAADGVAFAEGAAVVAAEPGPASGHSPGVTLVLRDGRRLSGTHLLVAAGRRPNLAGLDADAAGLRTSARGIATDAGLRCAGNRTIWAVGDIADPEGIGPRYFTHVGAYHAGIVVRRLLFRLPARVDYAALPRVTYTDPELAQVGLTEVEARAAGHRDAAVLRWPMAENDRAVAEGRVGGEARLVVTRRGRILGAGILAPHGGEMISAWTLAIGRRLPLSVMAGLVVPYPTRSDAAKRAAGNFFAPRLFASRTGSLVRFLFRLP